ncbi:hypothetical protein NL676_030960 [Syzygium grande]|nr:hypothetical protein NL676_030960 [Syzygium grande]
MVQNPPRSPRRLLPSLLVAPPLLQALARRRRPPAPARPPRPPLVRTTRAFPLRRLFSRFENRAKLLNMKEVPNFSAVRNSRTSS